MHQTMHHTLASGMASHGMANKQIALVWQKVWILMGIKCIYKYMYMYVWNTARIIVSIQHNTAEWRR